MTQSLSLVLAETVWALGSVYDLNGDRIVTAVSMSIDHEQLVLQDEDIVGAALAVFEKQSNVGFTDCLIAEVAGKLGHRPLGTFDKALSRLDAASEL